MAVKAAFFIIDTNSRAENLDYHHDWTWEAILERVYLHGMSAGSDTPMPSFLYRNGKLVATCLWDIAYRWGKERDKLRAEAAAALTAKFPCPWETDDGK